MPGHVGELGDEPLVTGLREAEELFRPLELRQVLEHDSQVHLALGQGLAVLRHVRARAVRSE